MSKTSVGKPLKGLEYKYEGPISLLSSEGFNNIGKSRTMILKPDVKELDQIPEEMFMVKISQSTNPEKAGKPLFRFLTFKTTQEETKFIDSVPQGVDQTTPLSEIKDKVVTALQSLEGAEVSLMIPVHGTFTVANLADGNFDVYNEDKFPSENKMDRGEPPYYIRSDARMTVTLTGAENMGNEYLRSRISSSLTADEVFQKKAEGKIWGEDESTGASQPAEKETGEIW